MKTIVEYLIKNANLKTAYASVLLAKKLNIKIDTEPIRQRMQKFDAEIRQREANIEQAKQEHSNYDLRAYQFDCQLKRKWLKYIAQFAATDNLC